MKLTLLTTPIGNISDVSTRLIEELKNHNLFFVEDSRQFYKLLDLLEINSSHKKVYVLNDHKQEMIGRYTDYIKENGSACVVSDAGSPVLSDPAFPLVRSIVEAKGSIESIPGPSAVTMAIELCGFPPIPFSFYGFLPRQNNELLELGSTLLDKHTYCFFESPHRILKTLAFWADHFPSDDIFVGRELTKKFESHYRFKAGEFTDIPEEILAKGEFVIAIHPHRAHQKIGANSEKFVKLAEDYLEKKTPKKLAKLLASIVDEDVKEIYNKLSLK